jgi:alpha-ketoglutarate-dependent 2,4-dichlorophenoxyacetate dioxygenase
VDDVTFTPLHPHLAAEVRGVDLRQVPGPELVAAIDAALDTYGVLVFRGQPLTEDEQIAFTRAFGPLSLGLSKIYGGRRPSRLKHKELVDLSNVDNQGNVLEGDAKRIVSNLANQLWHSDSSFEKPAARYSMLHAVAVPDQGGNTEFADARAAYDALDPELAARVEHLRAEHSALYSRTMLGDTDYTDEQRAVLPPVEWPIVRTHPSGRRLLFIGAHCTHIVGLNVAEGRMLLADLLEHTTQRRFVYAHVWRAGDLVIWDNRAILHRGRSFDLGVRRELRRSTTEDTTSDVGVLATT